MSMRLGEKLMMILEFCAPCGKNAIDAPNGVVNNACRKFKPSESSVGGMILLPYLATSALTAALIHLTRGAGWHQ